MKNHPHIEPGDAESWLSPGGCQVWFPNGQPIIPREILYPAPVFVFRLPQPDGKE